MSKNKDIVLSIGLLVSNRRDTIQKCLDSLAPIREAIGTELIIIDTGCDADLHELLEKYADKIECFTWCQDFAKARNASLALATGEWFMYLDDDEWFIDTKAIIDFFQSGKYKDYGSAAYIQRNYLDFEGSQYTDTWVGRMSKITPDTCFKSKIHEYMTPTVGADIDLNAIVEHYGYVYKTEEDKRKHFERNFTLLKEMVAEEADELRWKLQLVQELRTVDAFEDMIAYGKEYLELLADNEGEYEAYAVGSFYASIIHGYMGLEEYAYAKEWCDKLRADTRVNKLALTLAAQISAKAHFYLGNYEDSITAVKQYFEYQKYFKFHRNELHLSQKVPFVGEVFDVVKIKEMYSLLICSGLKIQDVSYLSEYMHKLKWNEKHLYVFEEIVDTLIEAMCKMGYRKAFYRIIKIIRAHSALNEYFYGKVEEWKENGAEVTSIENIDKWGIRKRTQKQLLEIVDSLTSVNTLIKSLVEMGNKEQLEGILSEAQNVAISLGTAIENGLGLGTVAVGILEQYCEVLWNITQVEDDIERQELIALLSELMEREREEITNFPIKTVAVFMPYKASMWDSLESVWLAARDDELCDDYVVPIPYFDLDGKGQLKKYNYEGPLFPEYVPVTFYENYNLEAEHPDMIYIHNPYDQFNTVTSVAPDYYCSKLKDYTDNLVYIPYFVLGDIDPNNQAVIDNIKHFCFLPGTLFANTVVVESENMRQIYINEFERATKRQGYNIPREALEKKFLGLGSPKYDKAVNTQKDDLDIPSEWLNVIEKPDGSWKKIIFYNTSLGAFLHDSEQMLEKIKDVLRIFKENKDEVALLWRPHPLMLQTIESMHPRLRNAYLEIVDQYKAEGWGIYDDTADMDRAVTLSDAYYGDPSSVVNLYHETRRPAFLQSVDVEENNNTLLYHGSVEVEGYIWFSAINTNGLFRREKNSENIEFVSVFPWEQPGRMFLHCKIVHYKRKLFCIPFQAKSISVYEIDTGSMYEVDLFSIINDVSYSFFFDVVQEDNMLYMIPCRTNKMIRFDCRDNSLECYEPIKSDCSHAWMNREAFVHKGAIKLGNKVYLGSFTEDFVEEYDLETNEIRYIDFPGCFNGIVKLLYDRNAIWVIGRNGYVCKWNLSTEYKEMIYITEERGITFVDALLVDDELYLIGGHSNQVYIYNIVNKELHSLVMGEKKAKKNLSSFWGNFTCAQILEDEIEVQSALSGDTYYINKINKTVRVESYNYFAEEKDLEEIIDQINSYLGCNKVSNGLSINTVTLIKLLENEGKKREFLSVNRAGKDIYDAVRN